MNYEAKVEVSKHEEVKEFNYEVKLDITQSGKTKKYNYNISDLEQLNQILPDKLHFILAKFEKEYKIKELKEKVETEGKAELYLKSNAKTVEIVIN